MPIRVELNREQNAIVLIVQCNSSIASRSDIRWQWRTLISQQARGRGRGGNSGVAGGIDPIVLEQFWVSPPVYQNLKPGSFAFLATPSMARVAGSDPIRLVRIGRPMSRGQQRKLA